MEGDKRNSLIAITLAALLFLFALSACSHGDTENPAEENSVKAEEQADTESAGEEANAEGEAETAMKMMINDTEVAVSWENNESVKALNSMAENGPVTIRMNAYGGFEQVGPIGETLPANDTSIKTKAGDIMLYTSDHMVIFYGSNSWAYTRLGRITDKSASELKELLSGAGVTVTVTAE